MSQASDTRRSQTPYFVGFRGALGEIGHYAWVILGCSRGGLGWPRVVRWVSGVDPCSVLFWSYASNAWLGGDPIV